MFVFYFSNCMPKKVQGRMTLPLNFSTDFFILGKTNNYFGVGI